ncbi:MAG: hypothetical protein IT437_13250 [Phycisphaerales bacterium]|nr:hypothetical protein [Phycisphaerales bacterium]
MEDQQAARCVLWRSAPQALAEALARRRVIVTEVLDPYRALATLCRLHRGPGGGPGTPPVLLLVEPSTHAGAADLVRAAWTYAPRAAIWMYEASANPQLRGVVETDVERWEQPPAGKSDNGMPPIVVRPGGGIGDSGTIARIGGPDQGTGPRERENIAPRRAPVLRLSDDSGVERGAVQDDDPGPEGAESPAKPRPLLSAEELEMLLSEQPEQDRGHG